MIRVIGLHGYATAGKDEAARGLVPLGFTRVSFGDRVRNGLLRLNPIIGFVEKRGTCGSILSRELIRLRDVVYERGWDVAKQDPEVRRLLQRYGTEAGRDVHGPDCWVRLAKTEADGILDRGGRVVFTDVRFDTETALVRHYGGALIGIRRPGVGPVNGHVSDRGVEVDRWIQNNSSPQALHAAICLAVAELDAKEATCGAVEASRSWSSDSPLES